MNDKPHIPGPIYELDIQPGDHARTVYFTPPATPADAIAAAVAPMTPAPTDEPDSPPRQRSVLVFNPDQPPPDRPALRWTPPGLTPAMTAAVFGPAPRTVPLVVADPLPRGARAWTVFAVLGLVALAGLALSTLTVAAWFGGAWWTYLIEPACTAATIVVARRSPAFRKEHK